MPPGVVKRIVYVPVPAEHIVEKVEVPIVRVIEVDRPIERIIPRRDTGGFFGRIGDCIDSLFRS